MSETNGTPTRQDLEAQLAERAWADAAFRAELRADPTVVIRRELQANGIVLPEKVAVHLHEETPREIHLVLPVNPAALRDDVLDDEALDLVAGGYSFEGQPSC